eukprot:TRINITY_DN18072_c0_g1_i1.p1 TRINITY_DN18072_c0_g1~~TRINITY_DN18072_c0_g1_i1.p1  ORF type:complete len:263 (-),score=117.41 TRINITY_DN18072_c0_g1_i1:114-902(-)
MFEAKLGAASLLKRLLDAIKDLVTEVNFDCSANGISLQAMDSSHVSLVSLVLRADGFEHFRCDRNLRLGINLTNMAKILKCANNDDAVTMRAEDTPDTVSFLFESHSGDKLSDFDLKLMELETEQLGIPDQEYLTTVKMPSAEFQRICRDISVIGDTVVVSVRKEEVKFSVSGDMGTGNISCRQSGEIDKEKDDQTSIELKEPVSQSFALRYLNLFTRATSLSRSVQLQMSPDVPLAVQYRIEDLGSVRFYLAPKIEDAASS